MSKTAVIFGAKGTGMRLCESLRSEGVQILCFVDNDKAQWGQKVLGVEVRNPNDLANMSFDILYCGTMVGKDEIQDQLVKIGVPSHKINKSYVEVATEARRIFVKTLASEFYKYGVKGSVAEAGVYRGDFAKYINEYFPDRKLYLFDTFEGFDERDIVKEQKPSLTNVTYMNNPNIDEMMAKMPNPQNIVIKKGYFPETASDVNEEFAFVNLDMDLYLPTLNGLRKFYPLLTGGGGNPYTRLHLQRVS